MRLKDIVTINLRSLPETTSNDYEFRYIDISNVNGDGEITVSEPMLFVDAPSRARRIIKKGDVIISTVRTYLKAIGSINFDATDIIVSTGFAVCTPKNSFISKCVEYAIRNDATIDKICQQSCGVSYPAITATALSRIEVEIPAPLSEQQRIVEYLDRKTSAIDRKIELLNRKLDACARLKKSVIHHAVTHGLDPNAPMKDSGVEWIGKVPEHWTGKRIKDIVTLNTLKSNDNSETYIALENIVSWDARFIVTEAETEGTNNVFSRGDILWGKLRPYLAKGFIPDYDGICSSEFFVLTTNKDNFNKYLLYFFLSCSFIDYINSRVAGAKMPRTNWASFGGSLLFIPSLNEQTAIAAYLDERCGKIDLAVEIIRKQIEALKRLKRAYINEAVTGRRTT